VKQETVHPVRYAEQVQSRLTGMNAIYQMTCNFLKAPIGHVSVALVSFPEEADSIRVRMLLVDVPVYSCVFFLGSVRLRISSLLVTCVFPHTHTHSLTHSSVRDDRTRCVCSCVLARVCMCVCMCVCDVPAILVISALQQRLQSNRYVSQASSTAVLYSVCSGHSGLYGMNFGQRIIKGACRLITSYFQRKRVLSLCASAFAVLYGDRVRPAFPHTRVACMYV
jgi:hypothetical protein